MTPAWVILLTSHGSERGLNKTTIPIASANIDSANIIRYNTHMAKSFLVSPGRAYLVIAGEGTKIVRANGTLIDTVPEGANNVSITVDTHEIIVMDNAAKIQQLYNGNSGSSGIMTTAEGEDAGSWKIEIVSTLPEQGSAGVIYMLRTNRTGTDRYDDYIWIPEDNAYELLGRRPESTSVDLSGVAKTDVANTFTKDQRVNGTLTATSIDVTRLNCDQYATFSTADVNYLNYETASGSTMIASRVTILAALSVDANASIDLPGLDWINYGSGQYIHATYDFVPENLNVHQTARVSNVLTLGSNGAIRLDGTTNTVSISGTANGVTLNTTGVTVQASDAYLSTTGNSVVMKAKSDNRTVFSLAPANDGKYLLNVNDGATLNGSVSMPGTLTVNNLNVTGTVTGINTGGGTPSTDFTNGVTIMNILTADDIVADDVTATTLAASSSVSVDGVTVAYRSKSEGSIRIEGDIVEATRVKATVLQPTNVQGATFTAPLTIDPNGSIVVWKTGGTLAYITNGDLKGFGTAEFDSATIVDTLEVNRVSTVNVLCQSVAASRMSVLDLLTVKDLDITGTVTGLPDIGGGGSVEIPDPLNVTNLTANAAVLGAVTVNNTLTVPEGVHFTSHLAFRKREGYQQVQLEDPGDPNASIMLGVYSIECTDMTVHDLNVLGSIKGQGANVHATEVWCFKLGSDHESQSNPIEVLSPLVGNDMLVSNSLTVLHDGTGAIYSGDPVEGCIKLGMDGYHTYPSARFAVGRFTVETNHRDGISSPILAILNESASTEINGLSTSIQKFKVAIAPAYNTDATETSILGAGESGMLELTGDNAWKLGGASQFALTARVDTLKIAPPYDESGYASTSPILTLSTRGKNNSSAMVSLMGTLAHYAGSSTAVTSYYMDPSAAYYYGAESSSFGIKRPSVYINPNTHLVTDVRALYSYHTNEDTSVTSTAIPGMYSRNMLCAAALTAGTDGDTPVLSQFGVDYRGVYMQKPIRALDCTSDITGLYYKPVSSTILPNLWQELVTDDGMPLSSVSEYTLDGSLFGLLSTTVQHPVLTSSFPRTGYYGNSSWEAYGANYDICVTSVEFGFSTGANGLVLTWPSHVIWPDEPDRLPPTQFLPNMCYRFVARMEPIPAPDSLMFSSNINYKWVTLVSQTYSYPNPWATT